MEYAKTVKSHSGLLPTMIYHVVKNAKETQLAGTETCLAPITNEAFALMEKLFSLDKKVFFKKLTIPVFHEKGEK